MEETISMVAHRKSSKRIDEAALEPSMDFMAKAYAAWLDQVNELSEEAFRFARRRLDKDFETAKELMRCSDSNQALNLQSDFASKLVADYLAESERLLQLMGHAATTTEGLRKTHQAVARRRSH
jgi:endoglucanase Acf2